MRRFVSLAARWLLDSSIRALRPPWYCLGTAYAPPAQAGHVAHRPRSQCRPGCQQLASSGANPQARSCAGGLVRVDEAAYEIDLSGANAARLRAADRVSADGESSTQRCCRCRWRPSPFGYWEPHTRRDPSAVRDAAPRPLGLAGDLGRGRLGPLPPRPAADPMARRACGRPCTMLPSNSGSSTGAVILPWLGVLNTERNKVFFDSVPDKHASFATGASSPELSIRSSTRSPGPWSR